MRCGPAKSLTESAIKRLLKAASQSRYPLRNEVIVLLTVRAGLRASEVAGLRWSMICDSQGRLGRAIELPAMAVKYGNGRRVPLNPQLRTALANLKRHSPAFAQSGPVVASERSRRGGGAESCNCMPLSAGAVVNLYAGLCRAAGLEAASSHSGRRTFITRAARLIAKVGGSLRDVQELAGHRSIETTQGYIAGDSDIQRRIVHMM